MKKLKNNISIIILVIAMLIGLSLLLYPTVSNWWNQKHQSRAIATYVQEVSNLDNEEYEKILQVAVDYNTALQWQAQQFTLTEKDRKKYESLLNIGGSGIMGYVDIPKINCHLPIYHGSDNAVMQVGIGHLEWTSLPVGGESSHCVLTGHRGLPSAKLFTHLDKLVEGDIFTLNVLDEVLTYEVDQILIVEPEETDALKIVEGEDYCTLLTCTPYGVNTHRLLVRGKRVDELSELRIAADAVQLKPLLVAVIVAGPMFIILTAILVVADKNKKIKIKIRREIK